MRILVTGATGFLGGHLAPWLAGKGHKVLATGRKALHTASAGIDCLSGDLEHTEFCLNLTRNIDAVVHCAAKVGSFGPYQDFYRGNVLATENLAMACLKNQVSRFIHIGTPSIYFDGTDRQMIKESDPLPLRQKTFYAETKLLAEHNLNRKQNAKFLVLHLRPRGLFGQGDTTFLGRFLPLIKSGRLPLVSGGKSLIDLTYIDNACYAIELALGAPDSAYGEAYNITNGEPLSIRELTAKMAAILGISLRQVAVPYRLAMLGATVSEFSALLCNSGTEPKLTRYSVGLMSRDQTLAIAKAQDSLGYKPAVSLEQGLRVFLQAG